MKTKACRKCNRADYFTQKVYNRWDGPHTRQIRVYSDGLCSYCHGAETRKKSLTSAQTQIV